MTSFVIDDCDPEVGELVEDIRRDVSDSISEKTETWKPKILISEEPFIASGRWIVDEFGHKCSHCGGYIPSPDEDTMVQDAFCRHCGAKMATK